MKRCSSNVVGLNSISSIGIVGKKDCRAKLVVFTEMWIEFEAVFQNPSDQLMRKFSNLANVPADTSCDSLANALGLSL